jgi:DNA mismatch repair protein MutS2
MTARAARELEHLQDDALKKKYRQRVDALRAQAAAEVRREKELAARPAKGAEEKTPAEAPTRSTVPIEVGMTVHVRSLDLNGKVERLGATEAEILAGALRMWRPLDDLEPTNAKGIPLPTGVRFNAAARDAVPSEINLLGTTVDDAVARVDKLLDDAFIAQLPEIRIVHGFGTGALRNAVAALLRDHPHVARFEPAPQSQGGGGVTLATLRV